MPFTTQDQIVAAMPGQVFQFNKTMAAAPVAGALTTMWDSTGFPAAGVLAVGNTTTGVVPTKATTGALANFTNPGTTLHLGFLSVTGSLQGSMILMDRVWHAGAFATATAGNIAGWTGTQAVTRPATGDQVMAFVEITTALAATATTITITFTNQAGTAGQTATCALPASAAIRRLFPFVMPAGSTGIRSIQTVNVGTAVATGAFNIVLATPYINLGVGFAGDSKALDYAQLGLDQVQNDACIWMLSLPTAATAQNYFGEYGLLTAP